MQRFRFDYRSSEIPLQRRINSLRSVTLNLCRRLTPHADSDLLFLGGKHIREAGKNISIAKISQNSFLPVHVFAALVRFVGLRKEKV